MSLKRRALMIVVVVAGLALAYATYRAGVDCDGVLVRGAIWWECVP